MAIAVETDQNANMTPSPVREDGASWPFALLLGEVTVYADSLTDLLGYVIPGYDQLPLGDEGDVLAFLERVSHASAIAGESQALVLAHHTESGEFDPADQSEAELTALFSARGTGLVDGSEFDHKWENAVPLVLLTTDFAPFTARPLIEGNVQYFDPSDERTYLDSLQEFGFVDLFVNATV